MACTGGCKHKLTLGSRIDTKEVDNLQEILHDCVDDEELLTRIDNVFNAVRAAVLAEQENASREVDAYAAFSKQP